MAVTITDIIIGAGTLSVSSYVAAGGAGSFTDVGATDGGVSVTPNISVLDIYIDQQTTAVGGKKTKTEYILKTNLMQANVNNLAMAWGFSACMLSGSTFFVGDEMTSTYKQLKFVGQAAGAPAGLTRTLTCWLAMAYKTGEHAYKKDKETFIPIEFKLYLDLSVTTTDKVMKWVDA
jgi:hypothetical protein